jgi:hypothetical protein
LLPIVNEPAGIFANSIPNSAANERFAVGSSPTAMETDRENSNRRIERMTHIQIREGPKPTQILPGACSVVKIRGGDFIAHS